jgi:dienelactone hydrolase
MEEAVRKLGLWFALSVFVSVSSDAAAYDVHPDANNPEQLQRVWNNTLVIFPQNPGGISGRISAIEVMVDRYKPTKHPAVIFLHGCSGLHMTSPQISRMMRAFVDAGYVVFAPNGLDRPHDPYCSGVANPDKTDRFMISKRLGELLMVRERIKQFDWVDQDNVFAAGHSQGAWAISQYTGTEFRGLAMMGYPCTDSRFLNAAAGVQAPFSVPAISVFGNADEWYPMLNLAREHCSNSPSFRNKPNRKSIVLPGVMHDVSADPRSMPEIVAFFNQHATQAPMPVAVEQVATTRFDGDWSGQFTCPGHHSARPFSSYPTLSVREGKFSWRVQTPSGMRGFDGQFYESGMVYAKGIVFKSELVAPEKIGAIPVEAFGAAPWFITMDAAVVGEKVSGEATWGNQPCTITLNQTRRL